VSRRDPFAISNATLQQICDAHRLGKMVSVKWAGQGMNNPVLIVNDRYVLRFDGLEHEGRSRFYGEKLAYEHLRTRGIPAPEVIALDVSRTLAAQDYLIMSKIEGRPMIDDWNGLSPAQRQQIGQEAGRYLAMMHEIRFNGYGKLLLADEERFPDWYAYVMDYLSRYGQEVVEKRLLSPGQYERLLHVFEQQRLLLEDVNPGRLVHWDYHFENILQRDGHITGIIDFEWSLSGDPMYDFKLRDQWEETCPGSYRPLIRGYNERRTLPEDYEQRVSLYQAMMHLDYLVDADDEAERESTRGELLSTLEVAER
jgi:aminoglycoside phosphotransferase (APT) family kinase protein